MPPNAPKEEVPTIGNDLLPILIIEEFARSDKPMTVANMNRKLGFGEAALARHFSALAEEGYIKAFGSPTTFVVSKRLVTLATDVLSK